MLASTAEAVWSGVLQGQSPGLGCACQGQVFVLVVGAIEEWPVTLQAFYSFTSKVISWADVLTLWDSWPHVCLQSTCLSLCVPAPPHPTAGSPSSLLVFPGTCLVSSLALLPACLTFPPGSETQIEHVYIYVSPNSSHWSSVSHFEISSLLINVLCFEILPLSGHCGSCEKLCPAPPPDLSVFSLLFLLTASLVASCVACSEGSVIFIWLWALGPSLPPHFCIPCSKPHPCLWVTCWVICWMTERYRVFGATDFQGWKQSCWHLGDPDLRSSC